MIFLKKSESGCSVLKELKRVKKHRINMTRSLLLIISMIALSIAYKKDFTDREIRKLAWTYANYTNKTMVEKRRLMAEFYIKLDILKEERKNGIVEGLSFNDSVEWLCVLVFLTDHFEYDKYDVYTPTDRLIVRLL